MHVNNLDAASRFHSVGATGKWAEITENFFNAGNLISARRAWSVFFRQERQARGCEGFNKQHGNAGGSETGQLDQHSVTASTVLEAPSSGYHVHPLLDDWKVLRLLGLLSPDSFTFGQRIGLSHPRIELVNVTHDARAHLTARVSSAVPLGCGSDLACIPAGCLLTLRVGEPYSRTGPSLPARDGAGLLSDAGECLPVHREDLLQECRINAPFQTQSASPLPSQALLPLS